MNERTKTFLVHKAGNEQNIFPAPGCVASGRIILSTPPCNLSKRLGLSLSKDFLNVLFTFSNPKKNRSVFFWWVNLIMPCIKLLSQFSASFNLSNLNRTMWIWKFSLSSIGMYLTADIYDHQPSGLEALHMLSSPMLLKLWSSNLQHPLGAHWKCRLPEHTLTYQIRIHIFTRFPSELCAL